MEKNKYWIWLSKIEGITSIEKLNLVNKYSIENLWNIDKTQAFEVLKTNEKVEILFKNKNKENLEKYLEYNYKNNIKIISINDKRYPNILKNIYDAPVVLYAKGNIEVLQKPNFAIVGARSASEYGKKIAKKFAYMLAKGNINVVSGLAKGIDAYSHIGALNAKGNTIAVVGSGLDIVYPTENTKLYSDVINNRRTNSFRIRCWNKAKTHEFSSKKQNYKWLVFWCFSDRS